MDMKEELKTPWILKITQKPSRFIITDTEGNEVASVSTSRSRDVRYAIAVGSLLAAAPELYEAAKVYLNQDEGQGNEDELYKAVTMAERGYGIANG